MIDGTTRLAFECGLRIQWTAFGDAQVMTPSMADKQRVVGILADVTMRRREAVFAIELGNEYWQNGLTHAEMRELAAQLRNRVGPDLPIALSCPVDNATPPDGGAADAKAMYEGSAANFITWHFDRNCNMVDGAWRPVRQPWDAIFAEGVPGARSNNEPLGIATSPYDSNPTDSDPYRQVAAAAVSFIAGCGMHVLHDTDAGVRGDKEWSEVKNIDAILGGLQALKRLLPGDLARWSSQNDNSKFPNHPFEETQKWVDGGASTGCVRAYAAVSGRVSWCLPIGIKRFVEMKAKAKMDVDVHHLLTGESLSMTELNGGATLRLTDSQPVYLVRGEQR